MGDPPVRGRQTGRDAVVITEYNGDATIFETVGHLQANEQ
jgi:hypothetical protein